MKVFEYLGHKFEPLRRFNKGELKTAISRLNAIGISNYKGKSFEVHNNVSDKWNYKDFYIKAAEVGAMHIDIFYMDGKTNVVPCENELFEYNDHVTAKTN